MERELKQLRICQPTPEQLELLDCLKKFGRHELLNVIQCIGDSDEDDAREILFIKPAGPEDFKVGDPVYRVLEDGTFEDSTVVNVWLNYMVVESVGTGKQIACQFRDVFHDSKSGAARTAAKERREIWESNVLRQLAENHRGHGGVDSAVIGMTLREAVDYEPPEPDNTLMGTSIE